MKILYCESFAFANDLGQAWIARARLYLPATGDPWSPRLAALPALRPVIDETTRTTLAPVVVLDRNGDIVGPFRTWRITNGEVTTVGQMTTEDVQAIQARLPK